MRLNPREARARRAAGHEAQIISAKIDECRLIAAWLWRTTFKAMMETHDRAAVMAAWREWKKMLPMMHFFATYGVLHFDCPRPACKRARRCACDSMRCVRYEELSTEETYEARAAYAYFIRFMTAPEDESEQGVRGGG